MVVRLPATALQGATVRLEPLGVHHVEALAAAGEQDRAHYGFTVVPAGVDEAARYVDALLADQRQGLVVPFAQVDVATGRVVGATRFLTLRYREGAERPFAVEIGGTWLASSAQRTPINTEAKLLLLRYAFETWGVARVDLKTDARNVRSRAAIARLGASFEGVLRQWQPSQVAGEEMMLRDSALYSVVRVEWPAVRARLESLLTAPHRPRSAG